jgi:hypothetical protein
MSTTTEERKADEESAENGKKRRPWLKWVLGGVALVVVAVVAVLVLGGSSSKKKQPPPPSGSLTAGKKQLLPLSLSGKLAGSPGQKVVGKGEKVLSVVRGRGFWVGGSQVDRVYIKYAPAGHNVGEAVDLNGTIKPAPTNVALTLKLSRDDAAKVTAEGAYIEASKVSPTTQK